MGVEAWELDQHAQIRMDVPQDTGKTAQEGVVLRGWADPQTVQGRLIQGEDQCSPRD